MKIPETSANVGAYYGNNQNGQWQPNGVIIDNGVGGGVVGSGDAGVRPVYPVHIPRHMPAGYVMAGAYYPPQFPPPVPPQPDDFEDYMWMENEEEFDKQFAPPAPPQQDDFADYMWMENEREFDKQVIQQLEEEALMEQCIEAMLEDEQRERRAPRQPRAPRDPDAPTTSTCNGNPGLSLEEAVSRSTLNPLAAEFVPTRVRLPPANPNPPTTTEVKAESTEAPSTEEQKEPSRTEPAESEAVTETKPEITEEPITEESLTPPKDPPEVSAADVVPIQKSKPKDKRPEPKKPAKVVQEIRKVKPVVVKSETKVQPRKKETKEVRGVKSEARIEGGGTPASDEPSDSVTKLQTPTLVEEQALPGLKPINYAAAAKAMKPKPKPTPTPTATPTEKPTEKKELRPVKSTPKTNKERVRKNSAK